MSQTDKNSNLSKKLSIIAIATTVLACIALIYFATILHNEYKNNQASDPVVENTPAVEDDKPLSILPIEPEGVTVLEKQAELETNTAPTAPIAAPTQLVSGYAMEVGTALSFNELSIMFSKIAHNNGAENFNNLEPRAVLSETVSGLQAKLLIGPFENENVAKEACEVLILPNGAECKTHIFEGELIARE